MLHKLIDIVIEASHLMLTEDFSISRKQGVSNIVTSSDIAVQEFLRQHLSALLPGSGFICEEEDVHDVLHDYVWIIDPIDGTANYSRGIHECAICVGLLHAPDVMEIATVYLPRTDELFTAERGKGAFLHHPRTAHYKHSFEDSLEPQRNVSQGGCPKHPRTGNSSQQIHVSQRPFSDSIMCTALPVYYKEYANICADIIRETFLQCNDIRRFGAAAPELCYLAMGRCELYFEYRLSPWDFAAASLILEEAGGVLCNLMNQPLQFTHPSGVLAANNKDNLNHLSSIVKKYAT